MASLGSGWNQGLGQGWRGGRALSGSVLAGSALFSLSPAFGLGKMVTGRVFPFSWSKTSLDSACFLRWGQAVGGQVAGLLLSGHDGAGHVGCPSAPLPVCRDGGSCGRAASVRSGVASSYGSALPNCVMISDRNLWPSSPSSARFQLRWSSWWSRLGDSLMVLPPSLDTEVLCGHLRGLSTFGRRC